MTRIFKIALISILVGWLVMLAISAITNFAYKMGQRDAGSATADTVTLRDTVYLPGPPVVREVPVPVPAEVDTAAILAQHYTERVYTDYIIDEPYLRVSLTDTVFRNRIIGRTANYTYRAPSVRLNALTLSAIAGHHHLSLMLGYRRRRTELMAGYDIYNRSFLIGAKRELFIW